MGGVEKKFMQGKMPKKNSCKEEGKEKNFMHRKHSTKSIMNQDFTEKKATFF